MPNYVEDMTTLQDLTEEGIMVNLRSRFDEKLIYTYTGSILVALNPFQRLDIYNNQLLRSYIGKRLGDMPPHIFGIAEAAYNNVAKLKKNQSVIISGESGAGKSESTKVILQYLTAVTTSADQESWIEQQILEANTVLESFGNAKTVRNNNSSRFGKFIQVNFNRSTRIIGASIINYLLEKSRIVHQAPSERNYHIFYELLAGATDEEKEQYLLEDADAYHYLNQSGCIDIDGVDDSKHFEELKLALTVLNITPEDLDGLLRSLSAVLHIGNMEYEEGSNDSAKIKTTQTFQKIIKLLEIDEKELSNSLLFRKLVIRGETSMVPYKLDQARDTRDAFAKALYDSVFQRIVDFINKSLTPKEKTINFVGVLDIFGFEVFKVNSFEQFCINYTNEKLQQFFNHFIFKLEQEEYTREGINWESIEFIDNQICLDLIEGKPVGILSLLDEETRFPKGADKTFLEKLDNAQQKHQYYVKPKREIGKFGVKHYAGEVVYSVDGFLEKNRDTVQDELYDSVRNSKNDYIQKIFAVEVEETSQPGKKAAGKLTAGAKFRNQLTSLVTTLGSTTPHYVRCIKSNETKEAFGWDEDMVLSQLRYSGMLDTIRIRKAGFALRLPYTEFLSDFNVLIPSGYDVKTDNHRDIAIAMCDQYKINQKNYACGKTKFFVKDDGLNELKDQYEAAIYDKIVLLQKHIRGHVARKEFNKLRNAGLLLKRSIVVFYHRRRFLRLRDATITVQSYCRGYKARKYYAVLVKEKKEIERFIEQGKSEEEAAAAAAAAVGSEIAATKPQEGPVPGPTRYTAVQPSKKIQKSREALATSSEHVYVKKEGEDDMFAFLGEFDNHSALKEADSLFELANSLTEKINSVAGYDGTYRPRRKQVATARKASSPVHSSTSLAVSPTSEAPFDDVSHTNNLSPLGNELKAVSVESLQEILDHNAPELQLTVYAEQYFETHFKTAGGFATLAKKKGNAIPVSEMLTYSNKPLPFSITKIPHKSDALDALALECFKVLNKALETPPNKKIDDLIKAVLDNGIYTPEIRDEIFVQIIKQLTPTNPAPKNWDIIFQNGWLILTLAICTFPPSKNLAKYLKAFFGRAVDSIMSAKNATVKKYIQLSNLAVKKITLSGPRRYSPSASLINLLRNSQTREISISVLDGRTFTIDIPPHFTAEQVVKDLGKRANLKSVVGWSLFEKRENGIYAVKAQSYIDDLYSSIEVAPFSPKNNKIKNVQTEVILSFRKRVYRPGTEDYNNSNETSLLFHQAADAFINDLWITSEKVSINLASLHAAAILGSYTSGVENQFSSEIDKWIPAHLLSKKPTSAWAQEISLHFSKLGSISKDSAKLKFLSSIETASSYGSSIFPVTHKGTWRFQESILLSVGPKAVQYINGHTKEVLINFSYSDIMNYDAEVSSLTIIAVPPAEEVGVESTEVYQFESDHAEEISALLREYCPTTEYMKQERDNRITDRDFTALVKDVENCRATLLEHQTVRIPGPDSMGKRGGFFTLRKKKPSVPKKKIGAQLSNHVLLEDELISTPIGESPTDVPSDDLFGDENASPIISSFQSEIKDYTIQDWSFSEKSLTTSILSSISPELDAWAITTHSAIFDMVGDKNSTNINIGNSECRVIQELLSAALQSPQITNELYLQLVKLTTNAPDADCPRNIKLWKIFAVCISVVCPTGPVLELVRYHLRLRSVIDRKTKKPAVEESRHAKYCYKALIRSSTALSKRKYAPSVMEISHSSKLTPIRLRFYLPDGKYQTIAVDSSVTVRDAFSSLKEVLGNSPLDGFAIYERLDNHEKALDFSEVIADSIFRCETIGNQESNVQFVLKKRLFLNPNERPSTDIEETLLKGQALANIAAGLHPTTEDDIIRLAALSAQADYGDVNYDSEINYDELARNFVPAALRTKEVIQRIHEKHMEFLGMSPIQATNEIMVVVRGWKFYGTTIFEVGQSYTKDIPTYCWLGISANEVSIINRDTKEALVTFKAGDILNMSPSKKSLLFITENNEKFIFSTTQAGEITSLWRDYGYATKRFIPAK